MRVASIHTYPVKGCYRIDQQRAAVEPWGLAATGAGCIVDAGTGRRRSPSVSMPASPSCGPSVGWHAG